MTASVRPLPAFRGSEAPEIEPIDWLVKQFLARGAGTFLVGQPGVSKTVHSAHLVACLVLGKPFLHFVTGLKPLNVLYLDCDSSWGWKGEVFLAAFRGLGVDSLPDNFWYYSPLTPECQYDDSDAPLALEALGQAIAQTVKEHKIDLVVCDSLGQMMLGDTNSAQDVSLALRLGLNPARTAGAAVLVIDHTTKASAGSATTPTPRGSQMKRAWARISVVLEREDGQQEGIVRWTVDKSNARAFPPFLTQVRFRNSHDRLEQIKLDHLGDAGARPSAHKQQSAEDQAAMDTLLITQ